ncbi:uncharacterized protein LOC125945637 [Dermacentor silvarum]|uniref:uncharacterized protein LOC125945637 n=1 Tax=Dermacentor silvarum TaxID=543639 RepID=UPI00210143F4|nr:uncharacterized protein LOC125945637 [Dermacentor silvarum]
MEWSAHWSVTTKCLHELVLDLVHVCGRHDIALLTLFHNISNEAIISRKQHADFKVHKSGSDTIIAVKLAPLPAEVTHVNQKSLCFGGEFTVLEAHHDCLLTALEKGTGGRRLCVLWNSNFTVPGEESRCFVKALSSCTNDMLYLTEHKHECEAYDASEKYQEMKANEELLKKHSDA